jgi:hypothetical protein
MTESDLTELRISRFICTPDSTPYMSSLSSDADSKVELGSQRMQNSLDDWDSYYEALIDEAQPVGARAPSLPDFEDAMEKEAAARGEPMRAQEKIELRTAVEKFKARMPDLYTDHEQPRDAAAFDALHFNILLPYLKEALKRRVGPGISIGAFEKGGRRVIQVMTHREVPRMGQLEIGGAVVELLPEAFRHSTTLSFTKGALIRSAEGMDGIQWCKPRNTYQYSTLEIGDSIGSFKGVGVSTSGPRILLGNGVHRVNCWHMWEDYYSDPNIPLDDFPDVHHPSHDDVAECKHPGPSATTPGPRGTGKVVLTSGYDRTTTRLSSHPYFVEQGKDIWRSVSDWTVSKELDATDKPNIVRMTGTPHVEEDICITSTSAIRPGSSVYSVGRSSGLQIGVVRRMPTAMDGAWNETGTDTFEWTVEQALTNEGEEAWRRGGLGIPGDSGAPVFEMERNALVGQVWATAMEDDSGHRVAYISGWSDIAAHISEKHPRGLSPKLPQRGPALVQETTSEPACAGCAAERAAYLRSIKNVLDEVRHAAPRFVDGSSAATSRQDTPMSDASTEDDDDRRDVVDVKRHVDGRRSSLHRTTAKKARLSVDAKTALIVSKVVAQLGPILDEGYCTEPDSIVPLVAEPVAAA